MNVAACIVTRGDQNLLPIIQSLPPDWEVIVWDNSRERDLKVYGRYAAIDRTDAEVIYVQDDDVIVSDPDAIVRRWHGALGHEWDKTLLPGVVCNMPAEFRHDFYEEHALVGFGAVFHRGAPERAFERFEEPHMPVAIYERDFFNRTCDIVFTALTDRVLVDVPKEDLPWAHYQDRMWKQPGHQADRVRMLDLVRQVRDA